MSRFLSLSIKGEGGGGNSEEEVGPGGTAETLAGYLRKRRI